jgi:hypothetical protein
MPLPNNAGSYLLRIAQESKWIRDGNTTIPPSWAEEMEGTLQFLDGHDQFECRLKRLCGKWRELVAELAEARTCRFFANLGFQIQGWQPPSLTGCPGDLLIKWGTTNPVFVEVKAPDWEGEFEGEMEQKEFFERKAQGKHVDGEHGPTSPTGIPFQVILRNALKKFSDDRPNMTVIVDDLRLSPAKARGIIDGDVKKFFEEPHTEKLGAILFLRFECNMGESVRCLSNFYDNPKAKLACRLAYVPTTVLKDRAERDLAITQAEAKRWADNRRGALEEQVRKLCSRT